MKLSDSFTALFTCEAPPGLPSELAERLLFCSCLQEKRHQSVYLVRDRNTGKKQILKITEPGATNNLGREHELLSKLDHPGIPGPVCYASGVNGQEYLLRSYVEGETLKNLLERDGIFSTRQTLEIAQKVCEILDYLHAQSPPVIYRDIAPDNIVITPNGKLSLIDFGISREDFNGKDFDTIYVGSTAFASPEQFGFTKTDHRSDIFAIGKLILYLATGNTDLRPSLEQIESAGFRRIIGKCTQLSPEKRYASVKRLSRAIRRQLEPPTRVEYFLAAASMLLVVGCGVAMGVRLLSPAEAPAGSVVLISAHGDESADEVKIPVTISVLWEGAPHSDCAVAVDNHHWYHPSNSGRAQLFVYAFDNYNVRAVSGNRTANIHSPVTRDTSGLAISLDLALVPDSPEELELKLTWDIRHEIALEIIRADTVTLTGAPPGVTVAQVNSGFSLIAEGVEQPGFYTVFAECTNDYGTSDIVISLHLAEERERTEIRTAQELNGIRENLSGHFTLLNDIDLSEFGNWVPVGTLDHPFTGTLDGNGFTISGLTVYGYAGNAGLLGTCDRAVVRNLTLRDPNVQSVRTNGWGVAALVGSMEKGLIQDCAVIGGTVAVDTYYYSSTGGICGRSSGMILDCRNGAEVHVTDIGRSESDSMAGGICGENAGYIADCVNTGSVFSPVMAGGISAFCDRGIITRCYNTGTVTAPVYAGLYHPGGIVHLLGRGKRISYCAFETGSAPVGATVWNGGTLLDIQPLDEVKMGLLLDNLTN